MRRCIAVAVLVVGACWAVAAVEAPVPVLPESLRWVSPPGLPGLHAAWVIGGEALAGAYVIRVRLDAGARVPAHTHPDERHTTVLEGTLYVGFGSRFDEATVVAVPAGAVYAAPAGVPHFLWARDGATVHQETGVGPTGTSMLPASPAQAGGEPNEPAPGPPERSTPVRVPSTPTLAQPSSAGAQFTAPSC